NQSVVAPGFNAPEVLSRAVTQYDLNAPRLFDWNVPITATDFLRRLYVIAMILCGVGAAIQSKRRDTRLLVALVAPWLAAFMLLTQMHGRYSIWAAGFAALLAGESVGLALLGLLISTVGMLGIVENQYLFIPDYAPNALSQLRRLDPHLGWVYLVVLAIFMYVALAPRRRRSQV
ncbi:MAG: hypothetical protein JWM57_2291, partial [Phycisphaerales bacterium]|nr:hypothetical protein [Phycisphaerales bacterium]